MCRAEPQAQPSAANDGRDEEYLLEQRHDADAAELLQQRLHLLHRRRRAQLRLPSPTEPRQLLASQRAQPSLTETCS